MPPTRSDRTWFIPAGLVLLSLIPFLAGMARLVGLAVGGPVTPENQRFVELPWPVVIHIVGATLFSLLGAFQFSPRTLRPHSTWHRLSGRVVFAAGLATALSGLWMTEFYPLRPHLEGPVLYGSRLVVGAAMAVFLVLGLAAILNRKVARHRAWMARAYALGLGAGTQVVTTLPWTLAVGPPDPLTRDLLMLAGWVINVLVAEWWIRNRSN